MTRKLSDPAFEPVYLLDQSIDTILGYDYLQAEVQVLSSEYPQDAPHAAVRQLAYMSLTECRQSEVAQARDLSQAAKRARVARGVYRLSGTEAVKHQLGDQRQKIDDLEKAPSLLFDDVLAEAKPEERDMIRGIVQRKIDLAKIEVEATQGELTELQAGAENIKAILKRPILAQPDPIEESEAEEVKAAIPEAIALEFIRFINILGSVKNGMIYERKFVETIYPDLYNSDRPKAYRQFDDMYKGFDTLNASQWYGLAGAFIQRGTLHQANQGGRPTSACLDIIYRTVPGDDKMLKSKGGVHQRITTEGAPHIIVWAKVTPPWK